MPASAKRPRPTDGEEDVAASISSREGVLMPKISSEEHTHRPNDDVIPVRNILFFPPRKRIRVRAYNPLVEFLTVERALESEGICHVAIAEGSRAQFLDLTEMSRYRVVMATDFLDRGFVEGWRRLPAELRSRIVGYGPLPSYRPRIFCVTDLLREMRGMRIWYQLAFQGIDFEGAKTEEKKELVRKAMRDNSFDLHRQLVQRCLFFAGRNPHNVDFLALPDSPTYLQMLRRLESSGPLLHTPNHEQYGRFVRHLTLPLRLIDADIRALRTIPERFGHLQHLRLLFNLELLRAGPYVMSHQLPPDLDIATPLSRNFRSIVAAKLLGAPIVFRCTGTIGLYFGTVSENFPSTERDYIQWLDRKLHSFFRFDRLVDPVEHHPEDTFNGVSISIDKWPDEYYDTPETWLARY